MTDPQVSKVADIEHCTFDQWPAPLRALFNGESIETKAGFTASLLATVDGRVRTSLLSVGELYAPDERSVCFSLWPESRTALAIGRTGRAALTFIFDEAFFQVQLMVRVAPSIKGSPATCFMASIETGEWQKVGYARLTHGIEFAFARDQEAGVLERWRNQVDVLKRTAAQDADA